MAYVGRHIALGQLDCEVMRSHFLAGNPATVTYFLRLESSLHALALFLWSAPVALLFYERRRDSTNRIYEYRRMAPPSKPSSTVFGRRLRQARLSAGIPQDRLGVAIGLDEATASARVSRYETGVHATPFTTAQQLAAVLGVPTAFLYCEDDELAEMILGWSRLSAKERRRIRAAVAGGAAAQPLTP